MNIDLSSQMSVQQLSFLHNLHWNATFSHFQKPCRVSQLSLSWQSPCCEHAYFLLQLILSSPEKKALHIWSSLSLESLVSGSSSSEEDVPQLGGCMCLPAGPQADRRSTEAVIDWPSMSPPQEDLSEETLSYEGQGLNKPCCNECKRRLNSLFFPPTLPPSLWILLKSLHQTLA